MRHVWLLKDGGWVEVGHWPASTADEVARLYRLHGFQAEVR